MLCLILCNPMDCTPPGSSVHRILQARILEWVAIPFFRGIFLTQGLNPGLLHCRKIFFSLYILRLCMLCRVQLFVTQWTIAHQALLSIEFSRQEYCSGLPCPPPGNLPNPALLQCRWTFYHLSGQGSPKTPDWVAYPFSRGTSRPRNQTSVSCTAGS